jgi:acyl-CoA thioester hydrolase
MEKEGVILPVLSLNINFKKSAFYDDVLKVKTQISKMPSVRIEFDYEITNQKEEIITTAKVELVFLNAKSRRPIKCPDYILDKLQN